MNNKNLNGFGIPLSDLKTVIADAVNKALETIIKGGYAIEKQETILSRKEAAILLKVSLPTLHNYTKTGRVQGYKLGGTVRYKMQDLENSLTQIKNN
jgi:excisionase family DNA binding protein